MVSILVVADIPVHGEGLVHALDRRDGIKVVATASSSQQALAAVAPLRPEVALVDVAATDGLTAVRSVVANVPDTKVVALATPETEADVIAYAEAGASGYVARDATLADVEDAILSAARGEAVCPPTITAGLLRRLADLAAEHETPELDARFTEREAEIVALLEQGLSNKEIALRLSIAVSTVKNHVHSILEKLHVDGRGAAVARLTGKRPPQTTQGRELRPPGP
jgi:DNA-binding NarL/FixJ family response regulator